MLCQSQNKFIRRYFMNRKPLLANRSIEEKLREISQEEVAEEENVSKSEILENPIQSSVIDSLDSVVKVYKRIGFDADAKIDDEIENVANNILKDKTTKKAIYNEIIEIGWPIWERKLKAFLEKNKKNKKI